MLKSLIAASVALPLLAAPALAEEGRLSYLDFQRANRCLAYSNLQALSSAPVDLGSLQTRFDAQMDRAFPESRERAKSDAREIRAEGRRADSPAELERLKARRDRACSTFTNGVTLAEK